MTFSIMTAECHYAECYYAECHYGECHDAEHHDQLGKLPAPTQIVQSCKCFTKDKRTSLLPNILMEQ
jgi:hypothetical protein